MGCIQDVNGAECRLSEGKLRVERRASRVKKRAYHLDIKKLDVRNFDLDLCSIF